MKAVSVRQPWAGLIVGRRRRLEIRSWDTAHRGPLLIHAGITVDWEACDRFGMMNCPTGAIIGLVELVSVEQPSEELWEKLRPLHLEIGPRPHGDKTFAWFLGNARKFPEPIPHKGRLGLFAVEDNVLSPPKYKVLKDGKIIESGFPGRYAGYSVGRIFGRLDCQSGMRMKKENRVFFLTWEDAILQGYRPCQNCKPTPND